MLTIKDNDNNSNENNGGIFCGAQPKLEKYNPNLT